MVGIFISLKVYKIYKFYFLHYILIIIMLFHDYIVIKYDYIL